MRLESSLQKNMALAGWCLILRRRTDIKDRLNYPRSMICTDKTIVVVFIRSKREKNVKQKGNVKHEKAIGINIGGDEERI